MGEDVIEIEDDSERESVDRAAGLAPRLIYEVIRRDGEEELARPVNSLVWSGVAAGILISLSVLGEAILRSYLPEARWTYLIENLGYSLGFIAVILGRMQLFTENTITTVLPVMARPSRRLVAKTARLWGIVLGANVVGAFAVALIFSHTSAIPDELHPVITELAHHATGFPAWQAFMRGIPAGVLVAAIVWMMPQSQGFGLWVILIFTWLIAAGDFTHVVAGSVEMAYLAWTGGIGAFDAVFVFFLPVLAGNILGGTAIFALLAYGQVKDEMRK